MGVRELNKLQMDEINKYKWIESQKAGRDLGDQCVLEWIKKFGADFRKKQLLDSEDNQN